VRLRIPLIAAAVLGACLLGAHPAAAQSELCPSDNPVVQENNCSGAGSDGWRLTNPSENISGFSTQTSVNLGQSVQLKIGRANAFGASTVNVEVYRMGYYGNTGGRLIAGASQAGVAVNNTFNGCGATNAITGLKSCSGWSVSYTIPGAALPASGIYTAKLTEPVSGAQNTIVFTVRDDAREPQAKVLFALPTASYQAYNDWGGKSLYFDSEGGPNTIAGTPRAVKVSFDRPTADPLANNRFFGPDFYMVQWLERQGYDVGYTDDVAIHQNPDQLLGHPVAMISGHSEYWSGEQFDAYLAARDAGVNIASFSSNTAYWKVRYENGGRTLVCYKTVQGSGSDGSGEDSANDWGPDGLEGTADDALGADGLAGTADDHPENSSTTFRDNGASPGDPNAPEGGRVGPDQPENQLFGSMYYGAELSAGAFPMQVTPTNAQQEFAGDRIWRNTGVAPGATTTIGTNLVGWEWDAVPTQAQYLSRQPAGVKRVTNTSITPSQNIDWLQDEGRVYAKTPPPGQCACSHAVKYTAPSGALVFSSGTNNWANALAPNADGRIIQATYNILSDMGVQPGTPVGLTLDPPSGPQPPTASFTVSPNPAQTGQTVTFDGTTSTDPDGPITRYEWDLDGNGTFETDSGANPITSRSYSTTGVYTVRLRVTDGQGERSTTNRALSVDNSGTGNYPSRVLGTTGLLSYWRMGDSSGPTLVDSYGNSNATTSGAPSLGATGALSGDADTAVSFDGLDDAATANLNLGSTSQVTVEFWMRWDAFSDNDDLALEFTPNFNSSSGGFLIDPNAPQEGGKFGVAIGNGSARNTAFFNRPSAGAWHHYAFVLDSAAAAADQVKPYVDGQPVSFTKTASGTGAGAFANSQLYFMSRAASSLFGSGDLDELAVYNRSLNAATIAAHYQGNPQPPVAEFTVSADPAAVGQSVTFDGSGSSSPNGAIVKYEWDLDGNGSFETDTGSNPVTSRTYSSPGPVDVRLRVTDSAAKTATATVPLTVEAPGTGSYSQRVLNTAGLINYWRMDDLTGSTLGDSRGGAPATLSGGPVLGAPGAVAGDPGTSVRFNGTTGAATANLNLSGTSKLTLEFWLKWNAFANDDDLAFEFTPSFNANPGGFLVDPNAPEQGGRFGVAIGSGLARNNAYFVRPSAGAWHHYALVFDATAAPADQIKPYVDGQAVSFTKSASGAGAGNFANSQLYFMSRAAASLFGAGDLDEVAVYNRALSAATIAGHFGGNPQAPTAAFTMSPNPAQTGQEVSFDANGSSDPDGSIVKYEWDLDGNGSYETDTGATAAASRTYSTPGNVAVGLRVTDNASNTATTSHVLTVEQPGAGGYAARVLNTAGLMHYWRMGDAGGSSLADSKGGAPAALSGGTTAGAPGALPGDADTAFGFDGSSGAATANVNLSATNKATLEFWLKWNAFANDDDLAFEFTPNFNANAGGFLVDPNAPEDGGKFAIGIGNGSARNTAYFDRPSAGAWHHYAFVLDTGAAAADQIKPYVDGELVPFNKTMSGTGAGNFASSQLYFMSRAAGALFGAGDLDEVAVYDRALSAGTISDHFTGSSSAPGQAPTASFTATPNPAQTGQTVSFNGAGSSDPDGTIAQYQWDLDGNGSFETSTGTTATTSRSYAGAGSVDVRLRVTDNDGSTATTTRTVTVQNRLPVAAFTATPNPVQKGGTVAFDGSGSSDPDGAVTRYEWDLDGNGSFETDTGATATTSRSYPNAGNVDVRLRVTDDTGGTNTFTRTVIVQAQAPTASFTVTPNPSSTGQAVNFNGTGSSDPDGAITRYEWDLDGNGSFETDTGTTATTSRTYTSAATVTVGLRVTDSDGATATTTRSLTVQNRPPTATFTASPSPAATRQNVTLNGAGSSDPDGTITRYEWDLDNNGSYETDGGATASITRTFSIVGNITLRLRVTDNNGATATSSLPLTVNSAYRAAILGTAGISDYWRLDESGTTATDSNGANNNGSYVNGPVSGAGLIAGEQNNARTFDGSNDYADMSPTPFGTPAQLSAEAWARTTATKPAGGYHYLITDSSNLLNNGFSLAIDSSNRPVFSVARTNILGQVTRGLAVSSVTVAPNTTHHIAGTWDGSRVRVYVDGVERANVAFSGAATWASGRDLRLGRPLGSTATQYHLQGVLDEAAIYTQALPAATVLAHYNAGRP
jgi:YD repeat-containing protein